MSDDERAASWAPAGPARPGVPMRRGGGLVALIAGLCLTAAFPPWNLWGLMPLGTGLAALSLAAPTWGSGLRRGFLLGIAFFTPLLHFTLVAMDSPLGLVALTIVQALYLAALGFGWSLLARTPWLAGHGGATPLLRAFAFAILWAGVEELRSSWPLGGFPFGRLAFGLADSPALPIAAYGASIGLSAFAALVGALGAEILRSLRRPRFLSLTAHLALLAVSTTVPFFLPLPSAPENGTLRVAAIQGGVGGGVAEAEATYRRALEVTRRHTDATKELASTDEARARGIDLVVWPENSADLDPRTVPEAARLVREAQAAAGAPILVGAVPYEGEIRYNDMVLWDENGDTGSYYRKHLPVPFGEYIPWREHIRRLTTQVDRIGIDMLPGEGSRALAVPLTNARSTASGREPAQAQLGMGICFEVAYDNHLRQAVLEGGQVLIIPTNNASFGQSAEAAQQRVQGRVQAVVHGRAVVQVSTTGYTMIVSPKGVVEKELPRDEAGTLVADVPLRSTVSVADQLGEGPTRVALWGSAALVVASILSHVSSRILGVRQRRHTA